eukprot:scaffold111704_cov109-Phaeocystis_antarctica.AAC.1
MCGLSAETGVIEAASAAASSLAAAAPPHSPPPGGSIRGRGVSQWYVISHWASLTESSHRDIL